ncbi:formylglycine-generating enzyme family protein [Rubripirellula sp.]|nr:formylglycine-generating enzyme family protein [Rubripirellula sp.]
MPDDFDPYYAWLGIPPKEQPCNLYRLLGLTIFEADLDVIEAAAARQIAHVRNYQLKHPEDATRVLQELVEAKSCLMNADRKLAYDQTLVIPVAVEHVPPPPVARDPIQSVPIQSTPVESIPNASDAANVQSGLQIQVRADQDSHDGKPSRHNKKKSSGQWFLIALGSLGGTGIAFLLLWLITGGAPLSLFTSTEAVAIAPFPANIAQDQQRAWARRLNLPIEFTNSIGMTFVLIPPGEFTMGYNEPQTRFYPAHRVTLTRPYYLGKTELTVDQYTSLTKKQLISGVDSRPHIQNWTEATAFCESLTTYEKGRLYRLPTEAEWEFAHRAGRMDLPEPQQMQLALASGWYKTNSAGTRQPVAKKPANAWGLHDMFGNVGEWVQDFPYVFPMVPARVDPQSPPDVSTARNSFTARGLPSPDGTRRITRGGSYNRGVLDSGVVKWYRYTTRHSGFQSSDYGCTGARILLEIDVAAQPPQQK